MEKIKRALNMGVSPIWAIMVIVVVATLVATGFLVYGYFWSPNEPQQQVKDEAIDWKTHSRNGNTLTFNYPSRICYDNSCYNLWIVELDEAVIISRNREGNVVEPVFKINYMQGIDRNKAVNYIESTYDECKIKSWELKGEIYIPTFVAPCGRIFAAYSKNSNTLVVFDLNQMACIFDCKTDEEFSRSIKLDGFALKDIYE